MEEVTNRSTPGRSPGNVLEDRVAVVTGATSGIGRAVAGVLAGEGARIVAVGRNAERLAGVEESLRQTGDVLALRLDVRSESDMAKMAARTLDRFGRIDILVAAAGIGRSSRPERTVPAPVAQLPPAEWGDVIESNLYGVFLANRAVLPAMIAQRGGDILNVSSFPAGFQGQPFAAAYSASKFAVAGLTEALQEEVRAFGIRVRALFPGPTDTPIFGEAASKRFGPLMTPGEVAEAAVFLLSQPLDSTTPEAVVHARGTTER